MKALSLVLILGVCSTHVLGDVKCYIENASKCNIYAGQQSGVIPLPSICPTREKLFNCLEEITKECYVDDKYDLSELNQTYNDMCTNGTSLNKDMNKYGKCVTDIVIASSLYCQRDIIDYAKQFKIITPEVIFNISKIACRERDEILQCFFEAIESNCGDGAKKFVKVLTGAGEEVNEVVCHDILNYKYVH